MQKCAKTEIWTRLKVCSGNLNLFFFYKTNKFRDTSDFLMKQTIHHNIKKETFFSRFGVLRLQTWYVYLLIF